MENHIDLITDLLLDAQRRFEEESRRIDKNEDKTDSLLDLGRQLRDDYLIRGAYQQISQRFEDYTQNCEVYLHTIAHIIKLSYDFGEPEHMKRSLKKVAKKCINY